MKVLVARQSNVGAETATEAANGSISVEDLYFAYGGVLILRGINLEIPQGQFVALIGPSGCGKSTLLNLIQGFLRADHGRIRIGGATVDGPSGNRAMIFQHFALMPWKTVLHNIMLGLRYRHMGSRSERVRTARSYIKLIGLEGTENLYPHQLSGGMQQRVGIARALAIDPAVLLLDEPFGALDAQNAEIMRDEISRLVSQRGRTAVMVTHNLDEALQLSDRILLMGAKGGTFLEDVDLVTARDAVADRVSWAFSPQYRALRERLWARLRAEVLAAQTRVRERP